MKKFPNYNLIFQITGDDLMIEADVSLAETTRYPVPIMAHPPINISDITLEEWLVEVLKSHTNKGIKLDFKSTRVVEPAFRVLAKHADFLKGPLVLNADILQGEPLLVKVFIFIFIFLLMIRFQARTSHRFHQLMLGLFLCCAEQDFQRLSYRLDGLQAQMMLL